MNKFIFSLVLILLSFGLFAQNLTDVDLERINSGTYALRERSDYTSLDLLPGNIDIKSEFIQDLYSYKPEICVEMLYVVDRLDIAVSDDEVVLYLLNNLRAFSEQVGVEYFSNRKQAMSLLIEECYFTSADGKDVLSDPVNSSIIPVQNDFYYQKDTTFGGNNYTLKTVTTESTIWMQMENMGKLTVYKFFKALDANGVRTNFIVNVSGDKVYIYALAQIKEEPKLKKILTYEVNIPFSFERRMNSIITWYKDRL